MRHDSDMKEIDFVLFHIIVKLTIISEGCGEICGDFKMVKMKNNFIIGIVLFYKGRLSGQQCSH